MDLEQRPHAVFIGRWQPWHYGHEWLIRQKLDAGVPVLIMIRDCPTDVNNPFTPEQVKDIIETAFNDGVNVKVMIISNVESVNYGRGVGYSVIEHVPDHNIKTISATKIREMIKAGDQGWREYVNPQVQEMVEEVLNKG